MGPDPVRRLKAAKAEGLKLIVIDPRRTETADAADLHLQILPGTDVALFNGIAHLLLWEGLADLAFIDADKPSNPDYLAWSLRLSRVGTLIIADNVVRQGRILDATSDDATFTDDNKALTEEDVCGRGAKAIPFSRIAPASLLDYAPCSLLIAMSKG